MTGNSLQRLEESLPVSSVACKKSMEVVSWAAPPVRKHIEMTPCQFITRSLSLCPFGLDGVPYLVNVASSRCPLPRTSNAMSPTTRRSIHQKPLTKKPSTKHRIPRPFYLGNTQCLLTSFAPGSPKTLFSKQPLPVFHP